MMRSSRAAVDLIVAEEVSSKEVYIRKYQHPEWPGGASGVTIGIGYDLGFATPARILSDWKDYLAPNVIQAMQSVAGLTGTAAKDALAEVRSQIVVPWDAAMAVFMKVDMPKWEDLVLRAVPGSDKLPAGCFGVLASISYNRGAAFSKSGDRYQEMRDIRTHVASSAWDKVPGDIRSMKRLWPNVTGLKNRREHEALLWEASLAAHSPSPAEEPSNRIDTGDERDDLDDSKVVTPVGNTPVVDDTPNVQPPKGSYSLEVKLIQLQLIDMKYFEVGDPDGIVGGKFVAGVSAFMTDRGKDPNKGKITPELRAELDTAKRDNLADGRPWSRPIAPSRANATATDLAPKVASVNHVWYQKLLAYVLGAPAFLTAGFKGVFGDQSDPTSYITAVKNFFGAIPPELYWLAVAGVAGAIFYQAKKTQDATVKDYNSGKIN
jgi:hypothetical protein